jgi:CRISPR/Cas system-associated protein Cas10 (large subunit of type III CRISPR-Cas system)
MRKSVTKQLEEAKERIKKLEAELKEIEQDRKLFRDWMVQDLRSYISFAAKNEYWSSATMIEKLTKRLQQAKTFYWG